MKIIENQTFEEERALYFLEDTKVSYCVFGGAADGESPLKECRNTEVEYCDFFLRYPFWHDRQMKIKGCRLTDTCRAALWYDTDLYVESTRCDGIKAFRECDRVQVKTSRFLSDEIFWRCRDTLVEDSVIVSVYPFFQCENLTLDRVRMKGKYSFQYVKNLRIKDSDLDTKDAFWHAENVTVEDSVVKGEYLGWYSKNVTLIRCKIIGTQPLCYCENLVLRDCTMEDCDFSFEYSHVDAEVRGHILSVKNPASGTVTADSVGEIIMEDKTPYPVSGKVIIR